MRIIDIPSKKILPIKIKNALPTYGGAYWLQDNSGVSYLQVSVSDNTEQAYLNTEFVIQFLNSDVPEVLFSRVNNPELKLNPEDFPIVFTNSSNEKYIISSVSGATPYHDHYYAPYNQVYNGNLTWKLLFEKKNKIKDFDQDGDNLIYLTAQEASNFKICKTSISNPNLENPTILVEENKNEVISSFRLVKDGLFYTTTKNGVNAKLYHLKKDMTSKEITLPKPSGSIFMRSKGKDYSYLSIDIKGWLNRTESFIYDFSTENFKNGDLAPNKTFDFAKNMIVEELTVLSHDENVIPLSLIYKKDLKKDGNNPVLMVGYGAYGTSIKPRFTKKIMSWVSEGGIFAIAHVRGGGEKGESWYKGGFKETKPNSWKDFISCTKFLIKKNYSSPQKM